MDYDVSISIGTTANLSGLNKAQQAVDGLAKAAGKYAKGPKLTAEQIAEARQKIDSGVPKAAVARSLKVSRQTLHTALKGEGRYAEVDS